MNTLKSRFCLVKSDTDHLWYMTPSPNLTCSLSSSWVRPHLDLNTVNLWLDHSHVQILKPDGNRAAVIVRGKAPDLSATEQRETLDLFRGGGVKLLSQSF